MNINPDTNDSSCVDEKKYFAEILKNLARNTDMKIILLNCQNNCVGRSSRIARL